MKPQYILLLSATFSVCAPLDLAWLTTACQRTGGRLSFCNDHNVQRVDEDVSDTQNDGGRNERETQAKCTKYEARFRHYCFNITNQPTSMRSSLTRSCDKFRRSCPGFITTPNPIEELPDITNPPSYVPSPCYHNCTEDHCTKRCKCDHYKPGWERTCKEDAVMPLWQQNCQIWHAACNEFYKIPPGYFTGKKVGSYGRVSSPHTSFHQQKHEVDVDWANGVVNNRRPWAVPAAGVSGSGRNVRFPGALTAIAMLG